MQTVNEKLRDYLLVLNHYQRAITLLDWDMYTAVPGRGYQGMADTVSFLSQKHFEISTSDDFYALLAEAMEPSVYETLDEGMRYSVRTLYRDQTKQRRIPGDFVRRFVDAQNLSRRVWEEAKTADDFSMFAPHLQAMIDLTRERCSYTDPDTDVYNVLLDQYEEGMHTEIIDGIFSELKEGLRPLLGKLVQKPYTPSPVYERSFPVHQQKEVQRLLLEYIGFDFSAGTTGESMHPFTLGFSRDDVRVTNHFRLHDPIAPMFSAIHEGGHAIFDQNVDRALMGTEAASCRYMGLHESQSRFYENILGRRRSFWVPVYDKIKEVLPGMADISLDDFVSEINHVHPSFIRTEADEVTYCLHIILRYEIEQAIFRDGVKVDDLPALWNEKTKELLGITPPTNREGILQDMHWSDASFGYFPSYLLGNIYDGLFLETMTEELGDIDAILEGGGILTITKWLNEKIHRYGGLRLPGRVIEEVCHKPLSAQPLLAYFTRKYDS